jgi:hypothetical protein
MDGIGNFGGGNFGPLGLGDGNNGGNSGIDFGAVLDQLSPAGSASAQGVLYQNQVQGSTQFGYGGSAQGSADVAVGSYDAQASWDPRTMTAEASAEATLVSAHAEGHIQYGDFWAGGSADAEIGHVGARAGVDGKNYQAWGSADAVSASAQANGQVQTPYGGASGYASAEGPSVHAWGKVGTTTGFGVDASVGNAAVGGDLDIAGGKIGGGIGVGGTAGLGLSFGETTAIQLPFVSAHVDASGLPASLALFATGAPVFQIGAAISAGAWTVRAAENLFNNPIGTVKGAVYDAVHAGESVVKGAVHAGESVVKGAVHAGESVVKDAVHAGESVVNGAVNAGKSVVNGAVDGVKKFFSGW